MELISSIVIGFLSIATLIYWYFKTSFSYWKKRNVPYVEPVIPYGNIKGVGSKEQLGIIMQKIYNQLKGRDKFCGVYFFTSPFVLLLDLELIKTILIKDFSYFNDRGNFFNEKVKLFQTQIIFANNFNDRGISNK